MMIEVLASVLSGAAAGPDRRVFQSQQFIAYDIDAFTDLEKFRSDMDVYLAKLRAATPAPGHDRVMYPGLNAHEVEQERRKNGIPYHPEVLQWFATTCDEQGISNSLPHP
jgi:LDH2 family malate/lactate/ureidoglycolate dehydrogenase